MTTTMVPADAPSRASSEAPSEVTGGGEIAGNRGLGSAGTDGLGRPLLSPRRRRTASASRFGRSTGGPRWQIVPRRRPGSVVVRRYSGGAAVQVPRHRRSKQRKAAGPAVRLTARGRVVICLAVLGLLLGAFSVGRASGAAIPGAASAVSTVVVQPGQTLWEIAGDIAPGTDRRATVAGILRLNPSVSQGLHPGQTLQIPMR